MNKILEQFMPAQSEKVPLDSVADVVWDMTALAYDTRVIQFATCDMGEDMVLIVASGTTEQLMPIMAELAARQRALGEEP